MGTGHRACGLAVVALLTALGAGLAGGQKPRPARAVRSESASALPPNLPPPHVEMLTGAAAADGWGREFQKDDGKQQKTMPADEGGGKPAAATESVVATNNQRVYIRPPELEGELGLDDVIIDRPELFAPQVLFEGRPFGLGKDKRSIYLDPVRLGRAKIRVSDPANRKAPAYTVAVQVVPDILYLNTLVRQRFPMANILVTPAGDDFLFVDGYVESPSDAEAVEGLLKKFFAGGVVNNLRVAGGMQVQLEVVIARVDRTLLRQLGVNILGNNQQSFFGTQIGSLINTPQVTPISTGSRVFQPIGPNQAPLTTAATAFFGVTNESGAIYGFIDALQQRNVAKILANPTLVTFSGRQADFLVGGEQPIPTQGTLVAPVVQFKPFGTRLTFLPTVLGGGRIRLDVAPEVSTTNFANALNVSGLQVPQFVVQRLHATVELQAGQTLCLGGLLQSQVEAQSEKIPVLGSLPWVGAAFRRVRHRVTETELLVLVTPRIFNPLRPDQVPQDLPGQSTVAPTTCQLYGQAVLEAAPGSAKHQKCPAPQLGDDLAPAALPVRPAPAGGSYQHLRDMVNPAAPGPGEPAPPPTSGPGVGTPRPPTWPF
jgi:pilus assembly protein CpaC